VLALQEAGKDATLMTESTQLEDVAEIIYDWIHEQQVTHRKKYNERSDEQKESYRRVARQVIERLNNGDTNE
jgi:hypothetical protein